MAPLPNETRTLKTEAKKTRAREIVSDFIDRSLPTCTHDKERVVDVRVTMYPESQRGMIDVEVSSSVYHTYASVFMFHSARDVVYRSN